MNSVPQVIIEYLLNKFNDVEAIILHGSRVAGYARTYSDWDFIVLTTITQKQEIYRHEIDGYHFEFKLEVLPIATSDIFKIFDCKLQFSGIVFDKNKNGKELLERVRNFYAKGIPDKFLDDEYKMYKKQNRIHILRELRDTIDHPAIFMKKFQGLYPQIINEWYWYKKRDYPKNLYISLPQIKKEDPWFSQKIEILYRDDVSRSNKVDTLSEIITYIYE